MMFANSSWFFSVSLRFGIALCHHVFHGLLDEGYSPLNDGPSPVGRLWIKGIAQEGRLVDKGFFGTLFKFSGVSFLAELIKHIVVNQGPSHQNGGNRPEFLQDKNSRPGFVGSLSVVQYRLSIGSPHKFRHEPLAGIVSLEGIGRRGSTVLRRCHTKCRSKIGINQIVVGLGKVDLGLSQDRIFSEGPQSSVNIEPYHLGRIRKEFWTILDKGIKDCPNGSFKVFSTIIQSLGMMVLACGVKQNERKRAKTKKTIVLCENA